MATVADIWLVGQRIGLMHLSLISLLLSGDVAPSVHESVPRVAMHFASAPQTCGVLQAAYIAASGHKTLIYPPDVRSDPRVLDLAKTVPDYRAKLALSAREFNELAGQASRYSFPDFTPVCNWTGNAGPSVDTEGHPTLSPLLAQFSQKADGLRS